MERVGLWRDELAIERSVDGNQHHAKDCADRGESHDAGTSVTAGEIETATGSLATFFSVFGQAIKTKNIEAGAEISVEEAVTLAADLGFGEPFTGIAKAILPLVFGEFNTIAAEPLIAIDDGRGGYVTSDWMHDARHQIDSDGNFTN